MLNYQLNNIFFRIQNNDIIEVLQIMEYNVQYKIYKMHNRRNSSIQRERIGRHNRLLKMIKSYNPTQQQMKKLERITINTMMQINLRYIHSDSNRHYKFPKLEKQQQQQEIDFKQGNRKQDIIYNLHSQNNIIPIRNIQNKIFLLDKKTRSLQSQRMGWQKERILRLNKKKQQNISLNKLHPITSSTHSLKSHHYQLKLPQLKKDREKLYTETRDHSPLQSIIGKKLVTQAYQHNSKFNGKINGMHKYLKKVEDNQTSLKHTLTLKKQKIMLKELV